MFHTFCIIIRNRDLAVSKTSSDFMCNSLYISVIADDVKQAWSLSANDMMDDDVEIINSDDLLDENDLEKPDPETLKGDSSFIAFCFIT